MVIRIAMVAGEASGDLLASHLIRALRRHLPEVEFYGIGGPKMQREGFNAHWPSERLAVHGYVDALKRYRELSSIRRGLLAEMLKHPPDAFIGVDAPDFNLWLEARMKKAGVPAIHFVSPSIWAWRAGRLENIVRSVTHMLCLFPFEPALYEGRGIDVTYVGHPFADELPLHPDRETIREQLALPVEQPIIALLPGSRQSEVRNLGPVFIETAKLIIERRPEVRFIVPLATRETRQLFEQALHDAGASELPIRMLFGHAVEAMTAADAVLVASGTASLEAALLKRPMVISYRMGKWQYRLMKRMAYLPWVGLPNILCRESVVPELLQDDATPEKLAEALESWLDDTDRRRALEERFMALHLELRQGTAEKAAAAILPYVTGIRA
ncbi:lipid-A-disaccharide synthase [Cognatazoarcus halotolerans]|uniref:lipid-A-disaccharide synthase n=1 Tax=Cognatazoarcus halotolerans TaxID=2686016 RepID=UPI00135ABEC9|nr:lipid-A-disaccharide synthase [Cognatazoarcus halotolerans]MBX3678997.1 lipid-A-disaccharide synthase [Rhodocyclaceae bacterium]MCB1898108.1 lipid-A-disaccharide synthase [Rhodocyclaceae bacterium]MCP5308992.1 lipid-A-disaccharide synthase [Zoogloeaceae bacterium]